MTDSTLSILTATNPTKILAEAAERYSTANTLEKIIQITAESARYIAGADGATFVLKENDLCYYVDENAIAPLWKGRRFPIQACISGWSMILNEVIMIRDIYQDNRIPLDAYRPTFVRSLCMVPIGTKNPLGVIGNYWAREYLPNEEEVKCLRALANFAAVALENIQQKH